MISVVVFFYSNTLQSMLLDYAVTEMGYFGDYSDAAPRAKIMRGNGITTLLFHVSPFITFHQTTSVTEILISKARLNSLYSRLDFKGINFFATSTNFDVDRKRFRYESGKSKALQKKNWPTMLYNHLMTCYNYS